MTLRQGQGYRHEREHYMPVGVPEYKFPFIIFNIDNKVLLY